MSWIETIPYPESTGSLRRLYDRVSGPDERVDNVMQVHSLRPHSMQGHMVLYKNVLHHASNSVPKWFLETLGVYTSHLNDCDYCVEHHYAGLARLLPDVESAEAIRRALLDDQIADVFGPREAEALEYARLLTEAPGELEADDVGRLRDAGWQDGEILEINQVVAYFNYANRTVLGLGVTTEGDVLGLSPGNTTDPENWRHA